MNETNIYENMDAIKLRNIIIEKFVPISMHTVKTEQLIDQLILEYEKNKQHINISINRDDEIDAFGAYVIGEDKILFNIEGTLMASLENNISFREIVVEILMHEFGHYLEELLKIEFSEKRINKIIKSYFKKFIIFIHKLMRE